MDATPAEINTIHSVPTQMKISWFRVGPTYNQCHISLLPNLTNLRWPSPIVSKIPTAKIKANGGRGRLPGMFEPAMSIGQMELYRKLLHTFSDMMFRNGLGDRFMLTAGTLVGSFHHHDFIPWDDDIDIFVDIEIRDEVRQLVRELEPQYWLKVTNERDKFFTRPLPSPEDDKNVELSQPVPDKPWSWPFVDISYYERNKTHITENLPAYIESVSWPVDMVFPLYFRPFGSAWYPAPRNPLAFLANRYGTSSACYSLSYSHALERGMLSLSASCELLAYRYPFVQHGPCDKDAQAPDANMMSLSEEKLVIQSEIFSPAVIHSLCLAADATNTRASSFDFGQKTRRKIA
ncbi:unnamed protein product [Calicophoron daubneyi]|uniref:LicD/FKTN/FKRP nucleotidyltransferase domain-containing protein n=1 Tax=Calicophoron daubneyi TaxID=300641 RepID=A0AAV2U051_CALDB